MPITIRIQLKDGTVATCFMDGVDGYALTNLVAAQQGSHFALSGYNTQGKKLSHIANKSHCSLISIEEFDAPTAATNRPSESPRGTPETGPGGRRREEGESKLRGTDGEPSREGNDKPSEGGRK